jgi:hypothetical protein
VHLLNFFKKQKKMRSFLAAKNSPVRLSPTRGRKPKNESPYAL